MNQVIFAVFFILEGSFSAEFNLFTGFFLFIKDFYLKQLFYYLPIKFFGDNIK